MYLDPQIFVVTSCATSYWTSYASFDAVADGCTVTRARTLWIRPPCTSEGGARSSAMCLPLSGTTSSTLFGDTAKTMLALRDVEMRWALHQSTPSPLNLPVDALARFQNTSEMVTTQLCHLRR